MTFHFAPGPDAYVAFDQGFAIILDLANNRYWALDASSLSRPEPSAAVEVLVRRGPLRALESPQASIGGFTRSEARMTYAPPLTAATPSVHSWRRFATACVWAHWVVVSGRLNAARQSITLKRDGRRPTSGVMREVALFESLRPIWPGDQVCLFDSLALIHFLLSAGHQPEMVFGVRARPFSAHCWVEHDGAVLSDLTGQFASYAVICRV